MGHNNVIKGTDSMEKIAKLVVIGHNNTVKQVHVSRLEVLGHNNSFKSMYLNKQPSNSGFNNKFTNCGVLEGDEDEVTRDNSDNHQYDSDSSDSSSNSSENSPYLANYNDRHTDRI